MQHLQRHHTRWPRNKYKTKMEKRYRNLPCNIQMLTAEQHKAIHRRYPNGNPSGKPSRDAMIRAIQAHEKGECKCFKTSD